MNQSQVPVDSLETIRNKLNQVYLSLRKLSDQINHHNRHPDAVKLPSYAYFQNQFQVLITQLYTIASNLSTNEDILKSTNVYPLPSFPTTQQEGLLTTLLRKKPLPEVEEWMNGAINTSENSQISIQKEDEFALFCASKVQELQSEFQFYGFHTAEELEYLETEEGKQETEKKKEQEILKEENEVRISAGKANGYNPNVVLKFMCQGVLP